MPAPAKRTKLERTGPLLTPGDATYYARDLSLTHAGAAGCLAAWVEDDRRRARVTFRLIKPDGALGPVCHVPALAGFPAVPRWLAPGRLVWVEFAGARGQLVWARFVGDATGRAEPVPGLAAANVGDFAGVVAADGALWLLVESQDPVSRLTLWHETGTGLTGGRVVSTPGAFAVRPRLVAGPRGVLAAWDEYRDGAYRVRTLVASEPAAVSQTLPAPDAHWETLSALAAADDGTWFAARCRERYVELPGGLCIAHSELVVATLGASGWVDVESVDIDHGLNPWMAGYTGARRFPWLLGTADGAMLAWEEKEDSRTFDPSPARFCALVVGPEGARGTPWVAATDVNLLVGEVGGRGAGGWLAAKTQTYHHEMHLPWTLHRVAAPTPGPARPGGLETLASAPLFPVRPPPLRAAMPDRGLALYFGDIHLHSRMSGDVDGEQDELYHFARDVARLDFCAFTENDAHRLIEPMTAALWAQDRRLAEHFNAPGRFTALLGWEYTKHAEPSEHDPVPNSHRCVLYPGSEGTVWHYWDDGVKTRSPVELCARLKGQRVLLHHHHGCGYDITDDELERNIELASGWFVLMADARFRTALHDLLRRGKRLGFFAAGDNHERNPGLGGGLVGVWAKENTREAIFEALWARRIFATTGLRPDLRFGVSGALMGENVTVRDAAPRLALSVTADVPVERVEFVRDGECVHAVSLAADHLTLEWPDHDCPPGRHWYYAAVKFAGVEFNPYWNIANAYGVHAWSSPVWVTRT